jgi:hypothetical protein
LLLFVAAATGLPAQDAKVPGDPPIYFYDSRLDGLGQSVASAAADVANARLFETQLANLDTIARLASDRIFSSARRDMLAKIEAARSWAALYERVERAHSLLDRDKPSDAEWKAQIQKLNEAAKAASDTSTAPPSRLKQAADVLEEAGRTQQAIDAAKFLQNRVGAKTITAADLRAAAKIQEALGNLGSVFDRLSSLPSVPGVRTATDRMKVDLAKAEIDHLNAMILIHAKRVDGERDVKNLLTSIDNALTCAAPANPDEPHARNCAFHFEDDNGRRLPDRAVAGGESVETTLEQLRSDPFHLQTVVYLLQNYAALAARSDTAARLADLRSAIEERRFEIRRDAIMARAYENVLLTGAQRIALYYKGGIKPEALAQFISALATAGLIPTIALK